MKREITDKKELYSLLYSIIMCDGGVYIPSGKGSNKNCVFIMNTTSEQYANYCKSIIENITSCTLENRPDYNTDLCNRKPQFRLYSQRHPVFTHFRERLYKQNYKTIDSHYLKLMNPENLAIIYMCDGCLGLRIDGKINSITLNLKRLTEGDQKLLSNYIHQIFGLEFKINKADRFFNLRLAAKDYYKFFDIIGPYILDDYQYKIFERKAPEKDDEIVSSS